MTKFSQCSLEAALQNEEKLNSAAADIATGITKDECNIIDFVEKIGFALTAQSVELRVSGTQLLSNVLNRLPADYLNEKQLEFLSQFYADRLKDNHNVIPAVIDGITALTHQKHLNDQSIKTMLASFFQNTTCQSQTRTDREKLFTIFKYLTDEYLPVLQDMGTDFVYGLINSIDGERDPRNLNFIFTFMPSVISRLPLLHLAEEMFEIFACYFPIDFTPSKNDPDSIKREDLSAKLINCLVASTEFAEWTIALAIEKLESDLIAAKLDSLHLLRQSAVSFKIKSLELHFEQIWQTLKADLLPGNDNADVVRSCLETLKSFLERARESDDVSRNWQTLVMGYVLTHLNDVNQRLFNPAAAIALVCVAGDAKFAADKILNTFLFKLQSPKTDDSGSVAPLQNDQRLKIYNIIEQIYKIASITDSALQHVSGGNVSQELHSEIISALKSSLTEDPASGRDLKIAAIRVLKESTPIISEKNRVILYQILVQLTFDETSDVEFTQLLEHLGALHPIELQSNFIDPCTRNFPVLTNFVKIKIYRNLLPLVKQMAFTERIMHLIFSNVFDEGEPPINAIPNDVREIALNALQKMLQNEDCRFIENLQSNNNLIDRLIDLAKRFPGSDESQLNLLKKISEILSIIIQNSSVAEQYAIVTTFLPSLNLQSASDLFVAKGLLGYLHKDISLDNDFKTLINDLIKLSLDTEKEELRIVAHHLIASIVNKIDYNNPSNRKDLEEGINILKEYINKDNKKAIEILSWLAKGLVIRGADEAADIIELLAKLLDHEGLSTAACLSFDIISSDYPHIHLPNVKFLFKQKFFQIVMAKLNDKLESNSEQHMNAFIYVLRATTHGVLKMHIDKIGPIIFKSLDSQNVNTLRIVLGICKSFIEQQDDYFRSHLSHFIPSLLRLSIFKESMQVRIDSLNLLFLITKYPVFALLPLKMDVVLELARPLDDSKRLVRNAAVQARNAWFLIGAPNGSEN